MKGQSELNSRDFQNVNRQLSSDWPRTNAGYSKLSLSAQLTWWYALFLDMPWICPLNLCSENKHFQTAIKHLVVAGDCTVSDPTKLFSWEVLRVWVDPSSKIVFPPLASLAHKCAITARTQTSCLLPLLLSQAYPLFPCSHLQHFLLRTLSFGIPFRQNLLFCQVAKWEVSCSIYSVPVINQDKWF